MLHTYIHTHTHSHTLASSGVEVFLEMTRGWEQTVCSPGAGSSLQFLIKPMTCEQWPVGRCHPRHLPRHQEGKKGRAKILLEVLVKFLPVSLMERPVERLIGAAIATGIQPI